MRLLLSVSVLALATGSVAAHATTYTFGSYSGTNTSGFINTATGYDASNVSPQSPGYPNDPGSPAGGFTSYTFDGSAGAPPQSCVPAGSCPAFAVTNQYYGPAFTGTTYVSYENIGNTSAGTQDAGSGTAQYYSALTGFAGMTGSVTFVADNYVTAYLNGNLVGSSPNLGTPVTFSLNGDFVNGFNLLEFDVTNTSGPTGLDFAGTATTPEPGSLVLLGTGVLGLAGSLRRRLKS